MRNTRQAFVLLLFDYENVWSCNDIKSQPEESLMI